jgi:hypothetical protein
VSDYRILVSRSHQRPRSDLYLFNLVEPIPKFSLPLQAGDLEPLLDLQTLLLDLYERSGYDYFINYQIDPLPPLAESELNWIDALLQEKGLR